MADTTEAMKNPSPEQENVPRTPVSTEPGPDAPGGDELVRSVLSEARELLQEPESATTVDSDLDADTVEVVLDRVEHLVEGLVSADDPGEGRPRSESFDLNEAPPSNSGPSTANPESIDSGPDGMAARLQQLLSDRMADEADSNPASESELGITSTRVVPTDGRSPEEGGPTKFLMDWTDIAPVSLPEDETRAAGGGGFSHIAEEVDPAAHHDDGDNDCNHRFVTKAMEAIEASKDDARISPIATKVDRKPKVSLEERITDFSTFPYRKLPESCHRFFTPVAVSLVLWVPIAWSVAILSPRPTTELIPVLQPGFQTPDSEAVIEPPLDSPASTPASETP